MAFRWRADDGPTLNADLVALWFFRGFGPVLLRNPIFLWFFRGGPGPLSSLWIRAWHVNDYGDNVTDDEHDEWPPCSLFISITTENGYQNNYYFISNEKRWLMSFLLVNKVIQLIFLALLAKLRGLRKHRDHRLAAGIIKTYDPVLSLFWMKKSKEDKYWILIGKQSIAGRACFLTKNVRTNQKYIRTQHWIGEPQFPQDQ